MKQKITLTIERSVITKLDEVRGDINRSIYIQRLLEKILKLSKSN